MRVSLPSCSHRPPCPGCPRFGEALALEEAPVGSKLGELARFGREAGVELALGPAVSPIGYRVRARLAIRGRASSPKLGIFQEGSHRVADIPRCAVQHPRINEVAAELKHAIRATGLPPYADAPHRGLLRYAQLVVERESNAVQLVLAVNTEQLAELTPLTDQLQRALGPRLHSLFLSPNTARTNAILGPSCVKVCGPDAVHERIAGADAYFPPDAFGQANLGGYAQIVAQIARWFDGPGATDAMALGDVLELYAGVGVIGLSLLSRASRVRFNELASGSLRGLRMGIDNLSPPLRARAEVIAGSAADCAGLVGAAHAVIADPPRKGLDPQVLAALCSTPPRRFVYVSCDAATFLRDARELVRAGRMRLAALLAFDLFPFTDHLEVLARFERV